jgi:AraC-like DNA-binding protein
MNTFYIVVSVFCFLLAMLSSFILFFVNKEQTFSNRLLALFLFFFGLQNIIIFLVYSELFLEYVHFYRVFGPTTLLLFPLSYLYVRSVLNGENAFRKYDWIIVIPSILYTINLIPVYILSSEEKLVLIQNYLNYPSLQSKFNDGFLPPYLFPFIRVIWSCCFLYLQYKLIKQFQLKERVSSMNKNLLNWVKLFTLILFITALIHITFIILSPLLKLNGKVPDLVLMLIVLVISFRLFTKPQLLYGLYLPTSAQFQTKDVMSSTFEPTTFFDQEIKEIVHANIFSKNREYKEKVDQHFKKNSSFLNPNYHLDDLVEEIKIPRHQLSSYINQEYGMNFRNFINKKRIEYIIENYHKPEWKNLTLEAIANESGFSNRSTFILNFKTHTGKSPKEFFKNRT